MRSSSARHDDPRKKNARRITLGSAWLMALGGFCVFYFIFFVRLHYIRDQQQQKLENASDKSILNLPNVNMMQVKRTLPETFAADNNLRRRKEGNTGKAVFNTTAAPVTTAPISSNTVAPVATTTNPPATTIAVTSVSSSSKLPGDDANAPTIPPHHNVPSLAPVQQQTPAVSTQVPTLSSFESRHDIVLGYDNAKQYLIDYKHEQPLHLFFVCSNDDGTANLWSKDCQEAEKKVYEVFQQSPEKNRLLTIRAGSEAYWQYKNEFRTDRDLRLKTVPAVMRWNGRGETSGVLNSVSTHDEHFLGYLFQIPEVLQQIEQNKKQIDDVHNHAEFLQVVQAYDGSYPLYLLFISGRLRDNNRPWCPYCRFSELPVAYTFHTFAHPKARLVRVEVSPSYQEYKKPENPFKHTPGLTLRGVPALCTVTKTSAESEITYNHLHGSMVTMDWLQETFSSGAIEWDKREK